MMVAVVVGGLIMLTAIPKLRNASAKSSLRSARNAAIALFEQARMRAIQESRQTTFQVSASGKAWVTAKPRRSSGAAACGCDTISGPQKLDSLYGVTVTPGSDSSYTFDPRGLSPNRGTTNLNIKFTKADYSDSVVVSWFGEVKK